MKRLIVGATIALALLFGSWSDGHAADPNVVTNSPWTCSGPVNIDLVKVTLPTGTNDDAISLGTGCTGRIGRVEVDGFMADGIKVQNASVNAAHDLVIEGGYIHATGCPSGAHQDGIQAMGGARITFKVAIQVTCGGGGSLFVNKAGSGATRPTDIVCDGCAIGQHSSAAVRLNDSLRSGARNSRICGSIVLVSGPQTTENPVTSPNTFPSPSGPDCTFAALQAYVDGSAPPPPPPPPPPPAYHPACEPTCDADIAALQAVVVDLNEEIDTLQAQVDELNVQIEDLEGQVAIKNATIANLQAQIVDYQALLDIRAAELIRLNNIIDAAQAALDEQ